MELFIWSQLGQRVSLTLGARQQLATERDDRLPLDQYTVVAVAWKLDRHVAAPRRTRLVGQHLGLLEQRRPVPSECAVGTSRDGIFWNTNLRCKESALKVDALVVGGLFRSHDNTTGQEGDRERESQYPEEKREKLYLPRVDVGKHIKIGRDLLELVSGNMHEHVGCLRLPHGDKVGLGKIQSFGQHVESEIVGWRRELS
jgi:hypothetical protein